MVLKYLPSANQPRWSRVFLSATERRPDARSCRRRTTTTTTPTSTQSWASKRPAVWRARFSKLSRCELSSQYISRGISTRARRVLSFPKKSKPALLFYWSTEAVCEAGALGHKFRQNSGGAFFPSFISCPLFDMTTTRNYAINVYCVFEKIENSSNFVYIFHSICLPSFFTFLCF